MLRNWDNLSLSLSPYLGTQAHLHHLITVILGAYFSESGSIVTIFGHRKEADAHTHTFDLDDVL